MYTVQEGQIVNFIIELTGEARINVDVSFATIDASAIGKQITNFLSCNCFTSFFFRTAPADYTSTSEVVTFNPSMTNRTVSVQTATDSLVEGDEMFNAALSLAVANNRINLVDNMATATIQDFGGKLPILYQNMCCIGVLRHPHNIIIMNSVNCVHIEVV